MTILATNVCVHHMMFNAKYEEDPSISLKVMANSIFEKHSPLSGLSR